MTNSSEMGRFFKREETEIPPFVPFVFKLSARVAQVPLFELLKDADVLSRALLDTQRLLGTSAIVSPIDPILELEAFGARINWNSDGAPSLASFPLAGVTAVTSEHEQAINGFLGQGRIPLMLDVLDRLTKLRPQGVGLVAGVTGPLS